MAAVLSALCSGSKRIRPALGIYMMTTATRLALCLRTQIIIKNFTAVHNRTLFLSVVLLCIKKGLAFMIASIAAAMPYCDLSLVPSPSVYINATLVFSSLIPCTFLCPSLLVHNIVVTFVSHHFGSVSCNRNLSHSVHIFICFIIHLTSNMSAILIGSLPFRLISHLRYDMIYLLTASGLSPGGNSTHLHTNNT